MQEIATEQDVLSKFIDAGGGTTNLPDAALCVTKDNLTSPSDLPSDITLTVNGDYGTNELVCTDDIAFELVAGKYRWRVINNITSAPLEKVMLGVVWYRPKPYLDTRWYVENLSLNNNQSGFAYDKDPQASIAPSYIYIDMFYYQNDSIEGRYVDMTILFDGGLKDNRSYTFLNENLDFDSTHNLYLFHFYGGQKYYAWPEDCNEVTFIFSDHISQT